MPNQKSNLRLPFDQTQGKRSGLDIRLSSVEPSKTHLKDLKIIDVYKKLYEITQA